MTQSKKLVAKFFESRWQQNEYIQRVNHYRKQLEATYPDTFNWETDFAQLREMVRCEIFVTLLDKEIMNDLEGSAWMTRSLKDYRDALFRYRRMLGVTHEMRLKFGIKNTNTKKSTEDQLREMLASIPNDEVEA